MLRVLPRRCLLLSFPLPHPLCLSISFSFALPLSFRISIAFTLALPFPLSLPLPISISLLLLLLLMLLLPSITDTVESSSRRADRARLRGQRGHGSGLVVPSSLTHLLLGVELQYIKHSLGMTSRFLLGDRGRREQFAPLRWQALAH